MKKSPFFTKDLTADAKYRKINRNFWGFGYPAVMITDTALYRNPNYHLPTDTMDTLDFDKIAEVVKAVTWTLLRMTS